MSNPPLIQAVVDEYATLQFIKQAGGSLTPARFHALLNRADINTKQAEDTLWEHCATGLLSCDRTQPAPFGTRPDEVTIHADRFSKNPEYKGIPKRWTAAAPQSTKEQKTLNLQPAAKRPASPRRKWQPIIVPEDSP